MLIAPPGLPGIVPKPVVVRSIWAGVAAGFGLLPEHPSRLVGVAGVTRFCCGYRSVSRGSEMLLPGTNGNDGSVGTAPEWMCLNAMMQASGSSCVRWTICDPGTDPRAT